MLVVHFRGEKDTVVFCFFFPGISVRACFTINRTRRAFVFWIIRINNKRTIIFCFGDVGAQVCTLSFPPFVWERWRSNLARLV